MHMIVEGFFHQVYDRIPVAAVREVLGQIGAGEIPDVLALNKIDLVDAEDRVRLRRRHPEAVPVSAQTGEGLDGLLKAVEEALPRPEVEVTLLVPFGREDLTARLYREAEVLEAEPDEVGTVVRARVDERHLGALREFVIRPVTRRVASERGRR
jgi:GTP-binding protein HflX